MMAGWSNPPLTLYHGTHGAAVGATPGLSRGTRLSAFVPSLSFCRPKRDFGLGFYTTTKLHQAKEWASERTRRAPAGAVAVVVGFDVSRDALAGLESLVHVTQSADFWGFVRHCRNGGTPLHGRSDLPGMYDVVYGPVTLWPQKLVIHDCDQVSFHTGSALGSLPPAYLAATARHRSGLF